MDLLLDGCEHCTEVLGQFGSGLTAAELSALVGGEEVHELGLCSGGDCISRAEFCLYMLVRGQTRRTCSPKQPHRRLNTL